MNARFMRVWLIAAALGLAACGDDDAGSLGERTLRLTEQQTDNFGFADNAPRTKMGEEGPEELSNADQITFSSDLLDASRKDVGDLDITCTITRPGGLDMSHQHCAGTASLADGSLTLSRGGRVFGGTSTAGAILGGSGAYAGATGSFSEAEEQSGRTPYTFRILLPKD